MNQKTPDPGAADTVFDLEEHVHPIFRPLLEDLALGHFALALDRTLASMHEPPAAATDESCPDLFVDMGLTEMPITIPTVRMPDLTPSINDAQVYTPAEDRRERGISYCWDCGAEIDDETADEFDGGCERCHRRAEFDNYQAWKGDCDRENEIYGRYSEGEVAA